MPTIGLSMIVRNEAKLILRCLESVRPLIDCLHISDTGSTDNTVDLICEFQKKYEIPGSINNDKWTDFATNRNLSLQWLRRQECADYAFVIDADDTLEIAPGFDITGFKAGLNRDVYDLQVAHGGVVHPRPQIFRNEPRYYWVGALHEYLEAPGGFTRANAPGLLIRASIEGSRNADPKKFQKDAEILKKALKTEKNGYLRARYTFYLAQSYRDAQDIEKALKYYLICSNMGFWDQQVYVSLLEAIRCYTKLGRRISETQDCFERAFSVLPNRAEAHHAMSFHCRQIGENRQGMEIARLGLEMTAPDGLFIEPWIYDYGLRDEFAVNAYWAGHYLDSLKANLELLANQKLPHDTVKRLADNAVACLEKLTPRFVSNTSLVFSD